MATQSVDSITLLRDVEADEVIELEAINHDGMSADMLELRVDDVVETAYERTLYATAADGMRHAVRLVTADPAGNPDTPRVQNLETGGTRIVGHANRV